MTKVRTVIIPRRAGYEYEVECAQMSDGSEPANEYITKLRSGAWPNGYDEKVDPDSQPAHVIYLMMATLQTMAESGVPNNQTAIKALRDGLWEVRGDTSRMAFFDVDGDGAHASKGRIGDRRDVDPDNKDDFWWFPLLDETLRLTHGFAKTGDKTEETDIELAQLIRQEDLNND